jgi:AcrB/AcrD/AcrF family
MNAIVLMALRRPYTFVVLAILILIYGVLAAIRTPTDIFPNIKIPVVAVVWTYNGLTPQDTSGRVIYYYERQLTGTVGNIEHIESQSLYGRGIVKIFFQQGTDVTAAQAQAQVVAVSQTVLKQMPTGITPPEILLEHIGRAGDAAGGSYRGNPSANAAVAGSRYAHSGDRRRLDRAKIAHREAGHPVQPVGPLISLPFGQILSYYAIWRE